MFKAQLTLRGSLEKIYWIVCLIWKSGNRLNCFFYILNKLIKWNNIIRN